ncbi:MAG: serpin family protein [bacterium]|nr:serpin family protein [bacterium]
MRSETKRIVSAGLCTVLLTAALTGCGSQSGPASAAGGPSSDDRNASSAGEDISGSSVYASKDAENTLSGEGTSGSAVYTSKDAGNALSGEGISGPSEDAGNTASAPSLPSADAAVYTDFAVRLFQECLLPDGNTLISPLSVINALTMTANGAAGETRAQMERLFGADTASCCEYLRDYNASLPAGDGYRLHVANSVWFRDDEDFTVRDDFLKANTDLFDAKICKASFDSSTLNDINLWVSENTDGMIPQIIDRIPDDSVMYLINALAFDALWQTPYTEYQVQEGTFTLRDGTEKETELMHSRENILIRDENEQGEAAALGFLKYYADGKYALVTLLPEEGTDIADYIRSLSGEKLRRMLEETSDADIRAALPKFETEYSVGMKELLASMGMTEAFDPYGADFSGIGSYAGENLYISDVIHKTYIAVDASGTKAGAATAVAIYQTSAALEEPQPIYITLDRPFVYMIIDCEDKLPVFLGVLTEP